MPVWKVSQKFCHLQWRRLFKELWGQTNNDCRFACWKIRFKFEVCTCSQFPTEALQWIKEVEMVDSVDDLMSSSSTREIQMPKLEVLDARIASALNRIIHNSHFKRRISLEEQKAQKQDRFLRGRQIAYLIYEYFRDTGANDSVENYADLFTIGLRNDSQREGLSVGHSSSVSERTGRSVGESTGRPVRPSGQELNVGNAQNRTLLDRN